MVESFKPIAPPERFWGYHALLKAYLSEGVRRDEALPVCGLAARVAEALKNQGVSGHTYCRGSAGGFSVVFTWPVVLSGTV